MRDASVNQLWVDLYRKLPPRRLTTVLVRDVPSLPSLKITFTGRFTAVCGGNGVGKTSLLRVIGKALTGGSSAAANPEGLSHLNSGRFIAFFTSDGQDKVIRLRLEGEGETRSESQHLPVIEIDPSVCAHELVLLRNEANVAELIEGIEPRKASASEIEEVNYILGKHYTEILTFEIEDLEEEDVGESDRVVPYFLATEAGHRYGSFTMGLGELSVHRCPWAMRGIETPSVVLLEEPEVHVAPFSQLRLLNVLASYTRRQGLWAILVTHSPGMLAYMPLEHIRLLTRLEGIVTVRTPRTFDDLAISLGVPSSVRALILTEDRRGADVVYAIFRAFDFQNVREVEVLTTGGESKLRTILETFPTMTRIHVIGIFDGDQRSAPAPETPHTYTFLPSNVPPEETLRSIVNNNAEKVAGLLKCDFARLRSTLGTLVGLDAHDWLQEFARAFSITIAELTAQITMLALEQKDFRAEAEILLQAVREAMGVV